MKKLIIYLILILTVTATANLPYQQKPMLGRQVDWSHPLAKDLVGLWLMNEGTGVAVADLSGNGHVGTLTGTAPAWTAGSLGYAVDLPGTDEYIDVTDKDDLTFFDGSNDKPFSVVMSINFDALGGVFGKLSEYRVNFGANDLVFVIIDDSSNAEISRKTSGRDYSLLTGQLIHLIFTYDGSGQSATGMKIYFNGVEEPTTDNDSLSYTAMENTVNSLDIGQSLAGVLNGKIESFSLYNCALSASEIAQLYREPFGFMVEDLTVSMMQRVIPIFYYHYINHAYLFLPIIPIFYYLRRQKCVD